MFNKQRNKMYISPEVRVTIVFIIAVIAFNIHELLIIPAAILGYIYVVTQSMLENPNMFSDLYQSDNKDNFSIQPLQPVKPVPTTNPLPGTMYISPQEKAEYLDSYAWKALKEVRLAIANYRCESCGSTDNLELHHTTYLRLTAEDIDDVRIQCNACHSALHDKLGYDRETVYPID